MGGALTQVAPADFGWEVLLRIQKKTETKALPLAYAAGRAWHAVGICQYLPRMRSWIGGFRPLPWQVWMRAHIMHAAYVAANMPSARRPGARMAIAALVLVLMLFRTYAL